MASKRLRPGAAGASPKPDNFKLIKGVGVAVESRLHQAGVITYAQLASLSAEEIVNLTDNLPGLTSGRIMRQDWIGQARELAQSPPENGIPDKEEASEGQHYSSFATELLLGDGNEVIHTRVMNIQTGDEEIWGGWDENRFVSFFTRGAGLKPMAAAPAARPIEARPIEASMDSAPPAIIVAAPDEPDEMEGRAEDVAKPEEVSASPAIAPIAYPPAVYVPGVSPGVSMDTPGDTADASPLSAEPAYPPPVYAPETVAEQPISQTIADSASGKPAGKMEVVTADRRRLLDHNQSFDVRIHLDLTSFVSGSEDALAYTAQVVARKLGDRSLEKAHRVRGKVEPRQDAILSLNGLFLDPGSYQLAAEVTIHPKGRGAEPSGERDFQIEGGMLQVY